MEDHQIISLLWQRSEDAIAALSEKFGSRLQRLAHNILSSDADAQECVNDTFLALWNTIPPQRPDPLPPYILRLCKNIAISRLRAATAQKRSGYEVALEELSDVIGADTLEQSVSARELGQAIDAFLDTLSQDNRVIFLRRHWYGDSVQEIARQLGMSQSNVSVRLYHTRNKLKTYLIKEGLYEQKAK